MAPLRLDTNWEIPDAELELRYVRSSGPGGQNVNKLATKVELRFKLAESTSLSQAQKRRLARAHPSHVTTQGDFLLTSDKYRSQAQNRRDALDRLASMILDIRRPPPPRRPTKPSAGSKQRRMKAKRERGELKRQRRTRDFE